jgi:hypothetical protein
MSKNQIEQQHSASEESKQQYKTNAEEATILLCLVQEKIRALQEIERKLIIQIQEQTKPTVEGPPYNTNERETPVVTTPENQEAEEPKLNNQETEESRSNNTTDNNEDTDNASTTSWISQTVKHNKETHSKQGIIIINTTNIQPSLAQEILNHVNATKLLILPWVPKSKPNTIQMVAIDNNARNEIIETIMKTHPNRTFVITKIHDEEYYKKRFKAILSTTSEEEFKEAIESINRITQKKMTPLLTSYSNRDRHNITVAHEKKAVIVELIEESKGLFQSITKYKTKHH